MLLGIRIKNYALFLDDRAGVLLEDHLSGRVDSKHAMPAGIVPVIPLSTLNAVIGRNQSGKTTFFDCLSFISDSVSLGCAEASVIRGRPGFSKLMSREAGKMEFELLFRMSNGKIPSLPNDFYLSYFFSLVPDINGKPSYESEKVRFCTRPDKEDNYTTVLDIKNGHGKVIFSDMMVEASITDPRHSALRSYGNIMQCSVLSALHEEITHRFSCRFSNRRELTVKQQIGPRQAFEQ